MHHDHSPSLIDLGHYTLCNQMVLGKGATGVVYKGYKNSTMAPVAIKAIDLATITDDATRSLLQNQKSALRTVEGQYVVKLLDIIQIHNFCYIVTEIYQGVTLKEYLLQKGKLSEEEAMQIFKKILIGCNSIVQNCIIHRDLKPANILISKDQTPTIIDFGFCQIIRAKRVIRAFNVGSPSYMSPEAYLRTLYSQKSDSWSLGVILYEMIHGKTMDEGSNIKQFFENVRNNSSYVSQNIQTEVNSSVRQIIQKALRFNTSERMSISGMKYLTDVYLFNKKKELSQDNTNTKCISPSIVKFNTTQHPSVPKNGNALQNILNECHSEKQTSQGFISFAQFFKPVSEFGGGFSHRANKSTQMRVSSINKNVSNTCKQIEMKLNQNTQNRTGRQHPNSVYQAKKQTGNVAPAELFSSRLPEKVKGLPAFRQVTVRYL